MSCSPQSWNNMFLMLGSDGGTGLLKDRSRTTHSSTFKGFFHSRTWFIVPLLLVDFLLLCFFKFAQTLSWRSYSYWSSLGQENQSVFSLEGLKTTCCFISNCCFPTRSWNSVSVCIKGGTPLFYQLLEYTACDSSCIMFSQALEEQRKWLKWCRSSNHGLYLYRQRMWKAGSIQN